ncbi:hypothetical protein YC2023_038906 [Brassica napus]
MGICPKTHRSITCSSEFARNFVRNTFLLGISSEYTDGLMFPRNSVGIFRGNSEETQNLGFLGISSEILRISFSVGMSVRIPMFSCSGIPIALTGSDFLLETKRHMKDCHDSSSNTRAGSSDFTGLQGAFQILEYPSDEKIADKLLSAEFQAFVCRVPGQLSS